jgi:transposase
MNRAHRSNYKKLYQDSVKQIADRDVLISLLQQQQVQMVNDRTNLLTVIVELREQLSGQQALIDQQREENELHKQTILRQAEKITQQQQLIAQQDELVASQQKQLDRNQKDLGRLSRLQYELAMLKRFMYGIKSEKRHEHAGQDKPQPGQQLTLSMEVESWGICHVQNRRKIAGHLRVIQSILPKKPGGRHDLPEGLPEEITLIDAPDKPANATCIGHIDQRQLACNPLRWYIQVTRRLVYLVASEDKLYHKQLIAPLPPHPIPKCKVDVSVLAMLLVDKYQYHLPVWRQQQRFRQYGIDLPYSTLCYLVNRTCEVLEPLWGLHLKEIMVSGLMNMDETRYRVLDNTKKKGKKSHIGWMWGALNPVQNILCFIYQKGRGKKDIRSVLQGYRGSLLTDAYGAYTKYGRQPGVSHQHCLSHARRYFLYALQQDAARASYAIDNFFGPLYGIEDECKELMLDFDAITDKRQAESLPVLKAFRQWLEAELPRTIPRTPIHQAIAYSLNHYDKLMKYTSDGMLPIDNNQLEGQIRAIALGRHNSLFAGSHRGGELAAVAYSFIATCKLQKIDPAKWLEDVLRRVPGHPKDKLVELLPQFWKPASTQKVQSA